MTNEDHLVNPELLKMARQLIHKQAFIPSDAVSGGGAPPGGDPSAGGGMPPGMDPSAGGGAPPGGDPSAGGGTDPSAIIQQLQQQVQQLQQQLQAGGGGGGAGGGGNALKPKIDVNSVLLSILKVQARIADQLGVKIPASEMVATQQDLTGLASATQTGGPMPGIDPTASTGGGNIGTVPPVDPMQGMQPPTKQGSYKTNGTAFDSNGLCEVGSKAAAIARLRKLARDNN